jgi:urease accessory protein
MTRLAIAFAALVVIADPALAHAPIKGIGTFYNGVLHPVLVPAHLLLVVGVGLFLGQHAPRLSRCGWFAFVAAFWVGLAAGQMLGASVPQAVLPLLALIAGLLVALELAVAAGLVVVLTSAAGVGIGLDSMPDGVPHRETWLALAGAAVGGVLLLSYVGGLAATLVRPWQRVGIRVAGSWTAASAGIVLVLALAAPKATG